ncbi:MAG: outer membrane protein assembly factor BamD [Chlamydiota bacterium]
MRKLFLLSFFCLGALQANPFPEIEPSFLGDLDQSYLAIADAISRDDWEYVRDLSRQSIRENGQDPRVQDMYYYLGVAYYHYGDFEYCNDYLTQYLETASNVRHFEEALLHKFWVAEHFRSGKRKRMFKWQSSAVYLSAYEDALEIYDQIVAALPFSELAVHSLYGKADVHHYFEEHKESARTYQTITQKFPQHELAIESYIHMGFLYLRQCQTEHLDPDLLDSAESNYRKFCKAFPGEERLEEAKELLVEMREAFANNLYETGRFYERTYKPSAAAIYYNKVLQQFPHTLSAMKCQERLDALV